MRRLVGILFFLALAAGIGWLGYALFADLPAPTREISVALPDARLDP